MQKVSRKLEDSRLDLPDRPEDAAPDQAPRAKDDSGEAKEQALIARNKKIASIIMPAHALDEEDLIHMAFDNHSRKSYFKMAWCMALYIVLVIIWLPGWQSNRSLKRADREILPQKRKVLRPPPETPLEMVKTLQKKTRKIPMPDLTPDEPEPIVEAEAPPEPDLLPTDDWEIGIPDAAPDPPERRMARVGMVGVEPPIIIKRVMPLYPPKAVKVKITGYVILEAVLRKDGTVGDIKILRGLAQGKFGFEEAAAEAVRKWEFLPGKVNDRNADVIMNLKIDFMIANEGLGI